MNWYKQANITQTWDKYLQNKVRTQIPNKEEQFYLNFRQGLINAEQLFTNEGDANSFINRYLTQNVMSLVDVDTGHIGDRIFSDIRSNYQATLPAEQRQSIKMNEVKQILSRELPGFNEEQINELAQDFVFNNKNIYEEIKKLKGDEVTDTKKSMDQEGIYKLYQITNWGTNGKLEKHIDTEELEEVHKDLESTSVCARFKDHFEHYMNGTGLFLVEESGKPYILYTGDNREINYTDSNSSVLAGSYKKLLENKSLFQLLSRNCSILLTRAINAQNESLVESILEAGTKPNGEALDMAIYTMNSNTISSMINHGAKPTEDTLNTAVGTKDIEIVQLALSLGAKPTKMTPDPHSLKMTPKAYQHLLPPAIGTNTLNKAIATGNIDIVKLIVDNTNVTTDRYTLEYAIFIKDPNIVKYALQLGAKLGLQNLHQAIRAESPAIIKLIIDSGIKLPKRDQSENIPIYKSNPELYLAGQSKNSEVIKLIVDFVNSQDTVNASNKNWYKTAQFNTVEPYSGKRTYLDIGHAPGSESEIWIWDRGRLFTDSGYSSHSRLISQLEDSGDLDRNVTNVTVDPSLFNPPIRSNIRYRYEGRFDNSDGKKIVSIKAPGWGQAHGISPRLIKDLEAEYGKDIDVHPF